MTMIVLMSFRSYSGAWLHQLCKLALFGVCSLIGGHQVKDTVMQYRRV